jgi:hypothetical protein
MSETRVVVQIANTGSPISLSPAGTETLRWPAASTFMSALINVLPGIVSPPRETVHFTRSHQRAMDRALRKSFKIIA